MRRAARELVERRPYPVTIGLAAALAVLLLGRHAVFGNRVTYASAISGEFVLLLLALAAVAVLGWWRETGLLTPLRVTPALPALAGALAYYLLLGGAVLFVFPVHAAGFALAALVGLTEELICRGLVVEILRPRGATAAVVGSAAFFGVLHLNNLVLAPSPAVVAQAMYAVLLGLLLGAARLQLHALWPVALVHAGIDLPGLATAHFLPPVLPNPWLGLVPVAIALPWGAVGVALLLQQELRTR